MTEVTQSARIGHSDAHPSQELLNYEHASRSPAGHRTVARSVAGRVEMPPCNGEPRRNERFSLGYAAPSNIEVTEPSVNTWWIARASSGAIGRIVSFSNRL